METTRKTPAAYRPGVLVLIERKLCAEGLQPEVKAGQIYRVVAKGENTKSGAVRITAVLNDKPAMRPRTLNSDRFDLRIVSEARLAAAEAKARKTLHEGLTKALAQAEERATDAKVRRIAHSLTDYEACQLAVVPLVIAELAWYYAEECCQICASERIPETRQLTRAVRKLRADALNAGTGYAGSMHAIVKLSEDFIGCASVRKIVQPLYYALRNDFLRMYPAAPYSDLRIMAEMALFFITAERNHLKWLVCKVPDIGRPQNEILEKKLWACMDAMRGNYVVGPTVHTENSQKIFAKLVRSIYTERNDSGDFVCECIEEAAQHGEN